MKTAVSIPDSLFEDADRLARERGMSRSQLYAQAIAQYVEQQKGLGVREKLDMLYSAEPEEGMLDSETAALQERSVRSRKW
jgi:metal-responsive CopG/Arc/MetJ family transcriptional regulator